MTLTPIKFTVEGVPRPKARARRGAGGRWYTPQVTKAYEEAVGWAARAAGVHEPCEDGVRLEIVLWMPDRRRRDLDNCAKSICDGLNGIVYLDDSQVAELVVKRRIDGQRPRAEITVAAIEPVLRSGSAMMSACRQEPRRSRSKSSARRDAG